MGAASRRLVRSRLAAFVVCAGGMLLAMPTAGLAAGWSPTTEPVTSGAGALGVATGFSSSDATAVWNDGAGIKTSVRLAADASWANASTIDTGSSFGAPDIAVSSDGATAVATWTDSAGSVWAAVRSSGTWGNPTAVASATTVSAPQAAIIGTTPTVFWTDGASIESSQWSGGVVWSAPGVPSGAEAATSGISDLRVAIASNGNGAAAWVQTVGTDTHVDSAVITNSAWASGASTLSDTADATTTVAVASNGNGVDAIAWSEPSAGMQVAISNGVADFAVEGAGTVAGATLPALAIDSNNHVFAAYVGSGSEQARIRTAAATWGSATNLGSGSSAPNVAGDASGDVIVTWAASGVKMRAYDATAPVISINSPGSPVAPGAHPWSVNFSDVWSPEGTATWTFSDDATSVTGHSVSHNSSIPGTLNVSLTVLDGAGNSATTNASITISAVAPTIGSPGPSITDGSAPNDGDTLHSGAGNWNGNPDPVVTRVWQRCDTGVACANIAGATGPSYTLTAADVGFKIRVEESATNDGGTTFAHADSTETPVVAPKTTGSPGLGLSSSPVADGVTLTATSPASDWDNAGRLSLDYRFQKCDPSCHTVQDNGSTTYTLTSGDVGSSYQVQVVATAGPVDGASSAPATETSSQTNIVAPKATAAPTLSGTTQDTRTLTADSPDSSWDGATGLIKTYVFYRCDANGSNCSMQQSTTTATYLLTGADLGFKIKVQVLANIGTSTTIVSDFSTLSAVIAPWSITAPAVPTGTTKDGATLTVTPGTWADQGSFSLVFSYQWIRCPSGTNCVAIPGAASATTYSLKAADVGSTIKVAVTATFGAGSTQVVSGPTAPVQPKNTAAAAITPPAPVADGGDFKASQGAWDGATGLVYTYQWKRCDSSGDNCNPISGANSSDYVAGFADVGSTLAVTTSASAGGSAVTPSPDSGSTDVLAPLSTGLADLSGAQQDTQTLTASTTAADWDGIAPANLVTSYQFMRCDSGGLNCAAIPGATNATYKLTSNDIGNTVFAYAFASKGGSLATRSSASVLTSIITPLLLGAPKTPTTASLVQDGATLSATGVGTTQGTWADQAALQYKYEWFRCSPTCATTGAPTATGTYKLQSADVGDTMQVKVTAFIGAGQASSTSTQTVAVAPLNTGISSITPPATQQDGQTFNASPGAWDGAVGLSYTYQWKRCDLAGNNCGAISGAVNSSYISKPADVGFTLRALVSAFENTSATVPASADSTQTSVIAPLSSTSPALNGTPTDGQVLSTPASTNSAWDNTPATLAFTYQWMRCDSSGASCAAIPSATTPTYTLTADDVAAAGDATHARHKILVDVTATVNGVSTTAVSTASAVIAPQDTTIMVLPGVAGDAIANQSLSAQSGSWTGTDIVPVSFQWVRSDPPFTTSTPIGAASLGATSYLLQAADVGHYVSFVETVANRLGQTQSKQAPFKSIVLSNALGATLAPFVTGAYVDGATLSTDNGDWLPADHLTFGYSWVRCAPNPDGSAPDSSLCSTFIPDADSSTYTLTPDDVGQYVIPQIRAFYTVNGSLVTQADARGDTEGLTPVAAARPVNTARPTVAGVPKQDGVLAASTGTWGGTNTAAFPITYAYQWLRCDANGAACQPISGATASTYTATSQDVGSRLVARVTGTNAGGSSSASSDATTAVAAAPGAQATGVSAGSGAGSSNGGTGGGGTHEAGTAVDKTAPKLTLTFVAGGKLVGGTTLSVDATCPTTEKSCKARFLLQAKLKKPTGKAVVKPVTIASASLTLTGGQKKVVKLKLSSAARTALKKALKLQVTLAASVVDAAGNVTPRQTKGITLRWKKP